MQCGGLRVSLLLFADDVVLMESSVCGLQHSVAQCAAECEAAGLRISTSKSKGNFSQKETCGQSTPSRE